MFIYDEQLNTLIFFNKDKNKVTYGLRLKQDYEEYLKLLTYDIQCINNQNDKIKN